MYTLGAGRILINSIIIVCLLNLMAWKASWAHRTGENKKKDNDKIKKVGPNVERLWQISVKRCLEYLADSNLWQRCANSVRFARVNRDLCRLYLTKFHDIGVENVTQSLVSWHLSKMWDVTNTLCLKQGMQTKIFNTFL